MGDLWLFVTKCSAAIAGSYKLVTALFDAHIYHWSLVFNVCVAQRWKPRPDSG
jgi:hypothetical protein